MASWSKVPEVMLNVKQAGNNVGCVGEPRDLIGHMQTIGLDGDFVAV